MEVRLGRLFRMLCLAITGRSGEVDWAALTPGDWALLGSLAQEQGVAPLLYWSFNQTGWPAEAPVHLHSTLTKAYYHNASQNAVLYAELERIISELTKIGIQPVLLKGAALACMIYPQVALRPMNDLDLLIHRDHLPQAIDCIRKLGYQPENEWLAPEIRRGYRSVFFYEANLDRDDPPPIHVELHWSLNSSEASYYYPEVDWFWQRLDSAVISGSSAHFAEDVFVLDETANTLFLAAHLMLKHGQYKHGLNRTRLIWSYDLHLILSNFDKQVDWNAIAQAAHRFHWTAAVGAALKNSQELFNTRLPEGVLERLGSPADWRSRRIERRSLRPVQTRLLNTLDDLSMIRWRWRLWLLGSLLFPSKEYMLWRYELQPGAPWLAYYPYRWWDVIRDGAHTLGKISRAT
jgi:hypothetical protein